MVKKSKNLEKSRKISKNHFFSKNLKIQKILFFAEKKNAIPLVLPIEEIGLRPELSTPFQNPGGWSERDGGQTDGQRTEILVSNIAFYINFNPNQDSWGYFMGKFFTNSVSHNLQFKEPWNKYLIYWTVHKYITIVYQNSVLLVKCKTNKNYIYIYKYI